MSRGLGKVQRTILDVLADSPHGEEMITLMGRTFHADTWPGHDDGSDHDYNRRILLWYERIRRDRPAYVSTFRAVQALERAGRVQTEIKIPKPIMGYLPPGAVRWKLVKLSVDRQ